MAPFKLKFRMGSSRSTSQEVDSDPQANQSLLGNSSMNNLGIGASNSTIDSVDCTSLTSIGNDRKSLLPNTANERLGYTNPVVSHNIESTVVENSPPPSYEHVLEEKRLANLDLGSRLTISTGIASSAESGGVCDDPNSELSNSTPNINNIILLSNITLETNQSSTSRGLSGIVACSEADGDRKESIDSTEYLISTMTTTPPSSQENLLNVDECTGSCEPLYHTSNQIHHDNDNSRNEGDSLCDDQSHQYCTANDQGHCQNYDMNDGNDESGNDGENDGNGREVEYRYPDDGSWNSNLHHQPQITTTEIISNKSSKKIYKAVAKQWGITCKMSDQCRCMECQSNYFDCEYEENENQKTDGGLGAGTPMFISEVMHGSACNIL